MKSEAALSTSPLAAAGSEHATPKIGVLGHFGDANLGDEAIIEAFVRRLRRDWPQLGLRIYSMHPADSARRYGCEAHALRIWNEYETEFRVPAAYANRDVTSAQGVSSSSAPVVDAMPGLLSRLTSWIPRGRARSTIGAALRNTAQVLREAGFLWRALHRVRGLDVMYVTGSNQFLDNFGGAWGFPYTLLKWAVLCRLVGCRVVFVSVGAGPLDGALSKWMIARALALADYFSFRDEGSRALIRAGCRVDGPVFPDLAHSLDPGTPAAVAAQSRSGGPLRVAINAMPVHDPRFWHPADPVKYKAYIETIGRVARQLQAQGLEVSFFATQFPDASVADDAIAAARNEGALEQETAIEVPATVDELLQVLRRADIVVATRFHGILLALLTGRPTVGICYYRKSRELLVEAGMGEFALDIDDFDASRLLCAVQGLVKVRAELPAKIEGRVLAHRLALDQQYHVLQHHLAEHLRRARR